MRVLRGEVGSGDTRRPVWVWAWDLGTQAVFHLCTPLCVTLNESICLSGPWLPHMLSDPKRNLQLRHLVTFLTIS